ncbi:hypothetical protein TrCOL_g10676 [Triparma columacea]|uniref:fructokinase n=1 Tax=Triparma columacea TaxID=722753 RepID=A0A9W7GE11_9STRA|nr:hypothetical protein TrCOL_g10676 [Triparma columacea]
MTSSPELLAAVEGGGTSFVVVFSLISSPSVCIHKYECPTTTPTETLDKVKQFLSLHPYKALGVATFGPVDLNPASPTYGYIQQTPKANWSNTDVLTPLIQVNPSAPYKFDTDVNAPALLEYTTLPPPASSVAYVTVGTGVGVGLCINGSPVHGLMHPEGGHVPIVPLPGDDFPGYSWGGRCPWKGVSTVESFAGGVGILERLGKDASNSEDRSILRGLSDDDEVWDHVANALACLCATLTLTCSVERIVLSGGVMLRECLWGKVRVRLREILNGYVGREEVTTEEGLERFIVKSRWGNDAGKIGALHLAKLAWEEGEGGGRGEGGEMGGGGWGKGMGCLTLGVGIGVGVGWGLWGRKK